MDTNRIREITLEIERLEEELKALVSGEKERKQVTCGKCGEQGHNSRACTKT